MRCHRAMSVACRRSSPTWLRNGVVVAGLCLLVLVSVLYVTLNSEELSQRHIRMLQEMDRWRTQSVVDLAGCRIPYIDPDSAVIRADWFDDVNTACPQQKRHVFSTELRNHQSCLVLHEDVLSSDYGIQPNDLHCVYYTVESRLSKDPWTNEFRVANKQSLNFSQCFDDANIWIWCSQPRGGPLEQPLFVGIDVPPRRWNAAPEVDAAKTSQRGAPTPTPTPTAPPPAPTASSGRPSVLVLGVDAVSRAMFHRNMKSTRAAIASIYGRNAFELLAFNKVGANSAPNQIPMLTGKRFRHESDMNHWEYFDDFGSFVWENFSQSGYTTLFAEEQMSYGLFNFPQRRGFRHVPTDHWPRPVTLARDAYRRRQTNAGPCLGGEYVSASLLRYWLQLQQISSSPTFSYIWLSEATHDSVSGSRVADVVTREFFAELHRIGLSANTVVFLLADHGYRIGAYRESPLGALEDMLPFGFVLLPDSFRTANPADVERLELNRQRLTTPYDIHATLLDLASRPRGRRVASTALGLSLLSSRIASERTCESAGIDPQYCACYSARRVPLPSADVPADALAASTLAVVNGLLIENNLTKVCVPFSKPRATHVVALALHDSEQPLKFLKVSVGTNLSVVKFESVFELVNRSYSLLGYPERLDRYDYYSSCVRNKFYEKFCYCA